MIPTESVDVVISSCVLNLVSPEEKGTLFGEIYRVLRLGGRTVISDIVCNRDPTPQILADPALWSGCIAGAFREDRFLERFEEAGFVDVEILARQEQPWQVVDGIEFRSMTVRAFKLSEGSNDTFMGNGRESVVLETPSRARCRRPAPVSSGCAWCMTAGSYELLSFPSPSKWLNTGARRHSSAPS